MAFEKSWSTVAPIPLTADGSEFGVIQVADTNGFKVKGAAQLANTNGLQMVVQVNQVLSSTIMIVGKLGSSPSATVGGLASGAVVDVSAFTVASGSTIGFAMQPKNKIKPDDIEQATYECDPTVAVRVIPVDPYGGLYGPDHPLPVAFDGTISIGDVTVVGTAPNHYPLEPNSNGSINVDLEPLTTFQTEQYLVGVSPVQITATPMPNRNSIGFKAVCTTSTDAIYIGNSSTVTTSNGYPLFTHDTLEMDLEGGETIYAIATSAGQTLCVVELGD